MADKLYQVYYNGIVTKHGAHVIALGWTYRIGVRATLRQEAETNNLKFGLEPLVPDLLAAGDKEPPPFPFLVSVMLSDPPRSLQVTDDFGTHQVQMCTINPAPSGENRAGDWVASGAERSTELATEQFIVIALTVSTGDKHSQCQIVAEGSNYVTTHSQVFGPASFEECETFKNEHCESECKC